MNLENISIFNLLSQEQIKLLEQISLRKNSSKNEIIFFDGDKADGFFIVSSGLVKIFKSSPDGKEQILHIFGPGEPFGEIAVFLDISYPANAQSLENSELIFFPKNKFIDTISTNTSLCLSLLAVLSIRLHEFTQKIENLTLKEVPSRLASYLIYTLQEQQEQQYQNNQDFINLKISKTQLASLICTTSESISRIFAKFKQQNLIEINGRNIKIIDKIKLEKLAGGNI